MCFEAINTEEWVDGLRGCLCSYLPREGGVGGMIIALLVMTHCLGLCGTVQHLLG